MRHRLKSTLNRVLPVSAREAFWRAYRHWRTRGDRYECPLCGARVRTLWPRGLDHPVLQAYDIIGGGYREQASCPICGSTERERLVYLYLRQRSDLLTRPARVLHVAPEPQLARVLQGAPRLDYLSADLYQPDVMERMDITDIHHPDASFDAIICNHVLEHVLADRQAMRELFRVLKPGGWAALQVPFSDRITQSVEDPTITSPQARAQAFGQEDHVRIYARADYVARLEEAGFRVEQVRWWEEGADFGQPGNRYGLMPREVLFIAHRD